MIVVQLETICEHTLSNAKTICNEIATAITKVKAIVKGLYLLGTMVSQRRMVKRRGCGFLFFN